MQFGRRRSFFRDQKPTSFLGALRERSVAVAAKLGRRPHLVAVIVGDDPASRIYVRNKERACEKADVQSTLLTLPASICLAGFLFLVFRRLAG